ncbi:MAG: hypothetical protein ACOYM3_07190 [Terrimicrobiaceae bacterium]
MSYNKQKLMVRSQRPPVVEFDPECGAVYVKFSQAKPFRTIEKTSDGMILTVDLDRSDRVIGIEAISFDEFSLSQLLKASDVQTDRMDFSKAVFRGTPRFARDSGLVPA